MCIKLAFSLLDQSLQPYSRKGEGEGDSLIEPKLLGRHPEELHPFR